MFPRSFPLFAACAALALALGACASSGASAHVTQASLRREGAVWIAAGRVHGDTAPHASARELVVELCDADGRAVASTRTRAELEHRAAPRVARGWDGWFRVELPATPGGEPVGLRVRSTSAR